SDDGYVAKFNPSASGAASLVYATVIGGRASTSSTEFAQSVAVDSAGRAYVLGLTGSSDFPTTASAYKTCPNPSQDLFLAVVNPTGTGLDYATCFGGSGFEADPGSVAVDSSHHVWITGGTSSTDLPVTAGAIQPTHSNTKGEGFFAAFDPSASGAAALVYSSYLGTSDFDPGGNSIAFHPARNAYREATRARTEPRDHS